MTGGSGLARTHMPLSARTEHLFGGRAPLSERFAPRGGGTFGGSSTSGVGGAVGHGDTGLGGEAHSPPCSRPGWSVLPDQFDVELVDHVLLNELQMTADLMAAANQSEASLSLTEIDRVLGVTGIVPGTQEHAPGDVGSSSDPEPSSSERGQVRVPRPRGRTGGVGEGT